MCRKVSKVLKSIKLYKNEGYKYYYGTFQGKYIKNYHFNEIFPYFLPDKKK